MPDDLCISIRFLQRYSHGRGEDGLPEWPPSPLRLFQALVAAAARRQMDDDARAHVLAALRWLERQAPPHIVASPARDTAIYRLYVPDNIGDRVAKSWTAGRDADLAEYRTEKDIRALQLDGDGVHYVFRDASEFASHFAALQATTRAITHLGWGVDMVAADATSEIPGKLRGEVWMPGKRGATALRCAVVGTLDALDRRHGQFLRRLEGGVFRPVPPLTTFALCPYARATDSAPRPFAAFRLLQPLTADRLSLDAPRRTRDVAAWTRHAVARVCEGWPFGPTKTVVHGHDMGNAPADTRVGRFSFLPLPTITPQRTEGIARVLVAGAPGMDAEIDWVRSRLAGYELVWNDAPVAILEPLPDSDWVLNKYVGRSDHWSTVTPIVLPGHDDRSAAKAERLLRKAFLHSGLEPQVIDAIEEIEWRKSGFRPGVELVTGYARPENLEGPMFHARVRFAKPRLGPIAIGSGRHRGLGLFAIAAS